jgi:hypothetical protein
MIITVASFKGGVAKTTTAVHLAALAGVPVSAVNDKRAAQGWADYQAVAREILV